MHSDHSNNGGGHDSAPNAEILSILRTIQENQKKQDNRMAEIENMCCDYHYQDDYDDYGDFNVDPGTSGEHYETASRKRASEDVDTCTDNRYVNAGQKPKVK